MTVGEIAAFDKILPDGSIVAFRLSRHYDFRGGVSQPGELRSARILESRPLSDEQSKQLRAILTGERSFGGEPMRCFFPGLGFRVGDEVGALEILVCLQCYWAYFFRNETRMVEVLSEAGHRQLSEIYVKLFPNQNPNTA